MSEASKEKPRDAWLVSWAAFVGGTVASVAANVAHARVPPPGAGPGWTPEIGPQIAAAFWPLALLGAIEVLTRVPWPRGWMWDLARYAGAGTVAAGAALLSYRHMAALLLAWGEDQWNAHVGPLVVDGLMVVAGTALLALSRRRAVRTAAAAEIPVSGANSPDQPPAPAGEDVAAVRRLAPTAGAPSQPVTPAANAATGNGAAKTGYPGNSATNNGAGNNGVTNNGATRNRGTGNGAGRSATAGNGAARNGSATSVPARSAVPPILARAVPGDAGQPGTGGAARPNDAADPHTALPLEEQRRRARADYRTAAERGEELSAAELGRRYGRSARWAATQIREAHKEMDQLATVSE
ncbi:DUF2637 domain-containing protein [Gandjariella thermophila]|uniref:DUF2637 domain-containing protein n=1 Tax=Gandjariella thermophila TaxID=1931992 RepID=UPI0010F715C9|nr:DUF2637 domain-containing protein [Gandjariella thermophila]